MFRSNFLAGLSVMLIVAAAGSRGAEWPTIASASTDSSLEQYGTGSAGILDWYQHFISPAKGGNTCPMYPSCSQYAKIAFRQLDPFSALAATCDRYVRCGREREVYPRVVTDGTILAYDPVTNTARTSPIPSSTNDAGTSSADADCCAFGNKLLEGNNYLPAELEFQRLLYCAPEKQCRQLAALGLLKSSYHFDDLDRFLGFFFPVSDSVRDDSTLLSRCGILLARRYFIAEKFGDVRGALGKYVTSNVTPLRDEKHLLASLVFLSVRDRANAVETADSISPHGLLRGFTEALDRTGPELCRYDRSPVCAGLLSAMVPGAGYLYVGRPQTAAASLLINGLFAWSAYDFFSHKLYGAGATSALLGSGFYFGCIRGSIKAASAKNRTSLKRRIAALLDNVHYEW